MSAERATTGVLGGVRCALAGARLITRPRVRRYVIIPFALNVTLFAIAIAVAAHYVGAILDHWLPAWLDFLKWLLWPVFALLALLVIFFGFTFLANLIGAPFNAWLAEAVERELGGDVPQMPAGWAALLREAFAALLSELRKLAYFALWALPLLVLSFILPPVAAIGWLVFSAWALTIEYADYPLGNHGHPFVRQREMLRNARGVALGFGAAITVMTMVPVLNFVAMPVGVAGATVLWHRVLRPANAARTP
ncbi:MAG: sulfate transporter CysZ [Gammaproteobacteria bacterium]|nr:sulfate transporter CysZ [Gammaproteobacteria bacterium]